MKFKSDLKLFKLFNRYKFILLIVVVGIVFMLWQPSEKAKKTPEQQSGFSIDEMENRLQETIANIQGAGNTDVVLSLKTDMEFVYQQDSNIKEQTDSSGGTTKDQQLDAVIISQSGSQTPVVSKRIYPVYQGALIVCEGGGSPSVQLAITQAVSALTGLGSNQITVIKMKD